MLSLVLSITPLGENGAQRCTVRLEDGGGMVVARHLETAFKRSGAASAHARRSAPRDLLVLISSGTLDAI